MTSTYCRFFAIACLVAVSACAPQPRTHAEERATLEASKDQWCRDEGFTPKTAQYKKCRAGLDREIARRQIEYAQQIKKEQADLAAQERENALEQRRLRQLQATQRPCEIRVQSMPDMMAGAAGLMASQDPNMRAYGASQMAQANAIQQNNALCRGDSQGYYQLRQLQMQQEQIELQRQQLQNAATSAIHCHPDGIGGFTCAPSGL